MPPKSRDGAVHRPRWVNEESPHGGPRADSYMWSYGAPISRVVSPQANPFTKPFIKVITPFITRRGPPCRVKAQKVKPTYLKVNPPKQALFQPKQGSFKGFRSKNRRSCWLYSMYSKPLLKQGLGSFWGSGHSQWSFLVPLIGGRYRIIPQLAVHTTYIIPFIYCLLDDYISPTTY